MNTTSDDIARPKITNELVKMLKADAYTKELVNMLDEIPPEGADFEDVADWTHDFLQELSMHPLVRKDSDGHVMALVSSAAGIAALLDHIGDPGPGKLLRWRRQTFYEARDCMEEMYAEALKTYREMDAEELPDPSGP